MSVQMSTCALHNGQWKCRAWMSHLKKYLFPFNCFRSCFSALVCRLFLIRFYVCSYSSINSWQWLLQENKPQKWLPSLSGSKLPISHFSFVFLCVYLLMFQIKPQSNFNYLDALYKLLLCNDHNISFFTVTL